MEPILKNLKKLKGEKKEAYLSNLDKATDVLSESVKVYTHMYYNFRGLIKILDSSAYVDVDSSTGMPGTTSIIGVNTVKKDIEKELDELKSKVSSGIKEKEGKGLEQMIVEKMKSKIYSFDTITAEEMQSKNTPFHEILNTDLALKDRMHFLNAIKESHLFSLDVEILGRFESVNDRLHKGNFELMGFNPGENRLTSYNFKINFLSKDKKRLFTKHEGAAFYLTCEGNHLKFKDRYEELLKRNFSAGEIDSMYSEVSPIKYLWLAEVSKITFDSYQDKNTGNIGELEKFFEECPEAFVFNVTEEKIAALEDHSQDFKKNKATETKKSRIVYKLCPAEFVPKLKEFYQGDENIRIL